MQSEAKKYEITKLFISGVLSGLTITETSSVNLPIGFRCEHPIGGSGYVIIAPSVAQHIAAVN